MILFLPLVEKLYKKHKIKKKRMKLEKRKRKVLNSKILNNPLYNSTPDNTKTVMVTIAEDVEHVVSEEENEFEDNPCNGDPISKV